jgi:hypothetical protein
MIQHNRACPLREELESVHTRFPTSSARVEWEKSTALQIASWTEAWRNRMEPPGDTAIGLPHRSFLT